jgi:hypothetical protein
MHFRIERGRTIQNMARPTSDRGALIHRPSLAAALSRKSLVADVFSDSSEGTVSRLPHDVDLACAIQEGLGCHACAQAVAGIHRLVETDSCRRSFYDETHGISVDAFRREPSVSVDPPEHRSTFRFAAASQSW